MRKANLRVVPHAASRQGSVALDVRASIACAADTASLSAAALAAANSSAGAKTAWDVRPWTLTRTRTRTRTLTPTLTLKPQP